MPAAAVNEKLWERAFQLSYFVLRDRERARECLARAVEKLAAQLAAAPDNLNGWLQLGRAYAVIDMDEKRAASALRLSPHYYNTEDELASVVEALRSVTARVGAAS